MYLAVAYKEGKRVVIFSKSDYLVKAVGFLFAKHRGINEFFIGDDIYSLIFVAEKYAYKNK